MKRILSIGGVCLLVALGIWAWRTVFPGDETRIRKLLAQVADTACLKSTEGQLSRLLAAGRLADFFAPDAVVNIDVAGLNEKVIQGRAELQQMIAAARVNLQSAEIRFPDVQLTIEPDHLSAEAHVAAVADVNGEKNAVIQELKFRFQKIDGKWKINQVNTVKTFGN